MERFLHEWVGVFQFQFTALLVIGSIEAVTARSKIGLMNRAWGIWPWLIYLPLQTAFLTGFWIIIPASGLKPLGLNFGEAVVGVATVILVKDLGFYLYHRAQHRWLWRWHATHHSIEHMTALNSYNHWSEILIWNFLVTLPFYLLIEGGTARNFFVALLIGWQVTFIHSDTKLHLGPLGNWIIDNRFHRIHHSTDPKHFDKNFGVLFSFWDRILGTAYIPDKGEWPEVGVAGLPEARSLRQWSNVPWRMPG